MTGPYRHGEVLHFANAVLRLRSIDQQFFRRTFMGRQLLAEVPDLQHLRVLERVARVELDPLLERQTLGAGTAVILQTHTPVRSLSENFVVYLARGSGFH